MKVLEIILPVLVMILLGMACKRLKLLDQNGINNMKLLVTQIMLPVAIFHALATAEYNKETGILVGIMFVMLVVSFSIGFLLRPLMPAERYRKYLPFMVSVYEGGSMAYPLYTSLCGAENLSQIAVLDIAGLLESEPEYDEVNCKMPKLNFETTAELSDILSRIGLENVFSDDADFSGIADKAVHVSSVLQKTKLELDENGTKAAAVTAVTMECMSAMDTDPIIKDVELTRPFAFLIYDSANEEVLFMGKVLTVQ